MPALGAGFGLRAGPVLWRIQKGESFTQSVSFLRGGSRGTGGVVDSNVFEAEK